MANLRRKFIVLFLQIVYLIVLENLDIGKNLLLKIEFKIVL